MQKYTSSINLHSKTLKSESLNEKKNDLYCKLYIVCLTAAPRGIKHGFLLNHEQHGLLCFLGYLI